MDGDGVLDGSDDNDHDGLTNQFEVNRPNDWLVDAWRAREAPTPGHTSTRSTPASRTTRRLPLAPALRVLRQRRCAAHRPQPAGRVSRSASGHARRPIRSPSQQFLLQPGARTLVGCGRHVVPLRNSGRIPRAGTHRDRRGPSGRPRAAPGGHRPRPRSAPARARPRRANEDREGPRSGHGRGPPRAHARQPGGDVDREPRLPELGGADEPLAGRGRGRGGHLPRPGHADLAGIQKFGHTDVRNVLERASRARPRRGWPRAR